MDEPEEILVAAPEEVGVGWFEWLAPERSTTHVAYLYESGRVYLPEYQVTKADFLNALSHGRAFRLYKLSDLEAHTSEATA